MLVRGAVSEGLETGEKVRIDTTVTQTNIHHPSDSSLLYDCVRVLARLFKQAQQKTGLRGLGRDRTKAAKRRAYRINQAKRQAKRLPFYRDLVRFCEKTVYSAKRAAQRLRELDDEVATQFATRIEGIVALANKVIDQTRRRVFDGESVPAPEKIVSIFEDHTDVIRKGGRDTEYGHKLCFSVGASTLVLDCAIETGAPADSTLAVQMVQRLSGAMGKLPAAVAFDGGFSSENNLAAIKELGVREVMFHRKAPLTDTAKMTSTPKVQ
jgi:IS5 family transposase